MRLINIRAPLLLIPLSVFALLLLSGCWSSREIEDLGLIAATSFDVAKEPKPEEEVERGGEYRKKNSLTLTFQYVIPQSNAASKNGGGGQRERPYKNITQSGDSVHQIIRELALRPFHPVFAQQQKVVVIGEELARKANLQQLLDQHIRDNETRPSCLVLIAKGEAKKTLEMSDSPDIPAFDLVEIVENQYRTTRILPPMTLLKMSGRMAAESSFLLQAVAANKKEAKFSGAAVMKGKENKLAGFLNEDDLEGLMWLTGKAKGGVLKSYIEENGRMVTYEVISVNSSIQPHVKGNDISFDVRIESEGRLSEDWTTNGKAFENEHLQKIETAAENEVKRLVGQVLDKMQKKYKADVAGFGTRLRVERPKVWETVKNDWDETFSRSRIDYSVNCTVKDYFTIDAKKK